MIIDIAAHCDIGCVRSNNEDMILVGGQKLRDRGLSCRADIGAPDGRYVVAVADGMGGAAAGEWASDYALTRLDQAVASCPGGLAPSGVSDLLQAWGHSTHSGLLEEGRRDPSRAGMGTTAVGLFFAGTAAWRFHAGDSRLYRMRGGQLSCLTQDHSQRVAAGDALVPANLLLNSLGAAQESFLECAPVQGGLQAFDRYLITSDGLHDAVSDAMIAAALDADRDTALRILIKLARDAGGPDNISAVIVDIGRMPPQDAVKT